MTNGELRFYLREIHSYWTTPHIAEERVVELHEAKLIERSADAIPMIRLTNEGAREKTASRPRNGNSTLSLVRTPKRSQRGRKNHLPPPRPLV
jgi:hypothetical protein